MQPLARHPTSAAVATSLAPESSSNPSPPLTAPAPPSRRSLLFVFLASFLSLFLLMSLRVSMYDESLNLVAAMRVLAGQVPHRDFYILYGPAGFYQLAALFKLFGPSIILERLLDLLFKSLLLTSIYWLLARFNPAPTRRSPLLFTTLCMLWLFIDGGVTGTAVVPVSLLNQLALTAILPAFAAPLSRPRLLAAGALAGTALLYRVDSGIVLFALLAGALTVAAALRRQLARLLPSVALLALGLFLVIALPLAYYITHVPAYAFVRDVFLFPLHTYKGDRRLPFPALSLRKFDLLIVYLPPIIFAVAALALAGLRKSLRTSVSARLGAGFLLTFAALAGLMYAKALVRISTVQLYPCILPTLVLLAFLYQQRAFFRSPVRTLTLALCVITTLVTLRAAAREAHIHRDGNELLPLQQLARLRGTLPPLITRWCHTPTPLTRGICFQPEDDRIQTILFLDRHTTAAQPLLIALPHNDHVFANDLLIYFATQRLPVTRWSTFEPDLQNTAPIQLQIIGELQHNPPPYIVLDSEFTGLSEPNGSSRSSGVLLLDRYIQTHYSPAETFGRFTVLQQLPPASSVPQ